MKFIQVVSKFGLFYEESFYQEFMGCFNENNCTCLSYSGSIMSRAKTNYTTFLSSPHHEEAKSEEREMLATLHGQSSQTEILSHFGHPRPAITTTTSKSRN